MTNWFSINRVGDTALVGVNEHIGCFDTGVKEFKAAIADARRVELTIDSHGGDSMTALACCDLLRGRDVTATVTGTCASAAVLFLLAARMRVAHSTSRLMVHNPVNCVMGNSRELRKGAADLERLAARTEDLYVARTGQPREIVNRWLSGDDLWFTAVEALKVGLLDQVVEPPPLPRRRSMLTDAPGVAKMPESEELFRDWLFAFGHLRVRSRKEFGEHLQEWFGHSVHE